MTLTLLLMLCAVPDAGVAAWSVTYETSNPSVHALTRLTPFEVSQSIVTTENGKRLGNALKPRPLAAVVREALTALLPRLPAKDATYSIGQSSTAVKLVIERAGKSVTLQLVPGTAAPPISAEVKELLTLVDAAVRL